VAVDAVNAQGERQRERNDGNDEANGSATIHVPLTVAQMSGGPACDAHVPGGGRGGRSMRPARHSSSTAVWFYDDHRN
jgi:hypothetical protein